MKGTPDCLPCLLRRTLCAARHIAEDPWLHRKVLTEAMGHLQKADLDRAPAELVGEVLRMAGKVLGNADAFRQVKEDHRLEARALEEALRKRIDDAPSPLGEALRLAARANALDAAVFGKTSLDDAIGRNGSDRPLAVDDTERLLKDLEEAESVLYVCNTAGEILIDTLAVERLVAEKKLVTCIVRRDPLQNAATRADAEWAGLTNVAAVIEISPKGSGIQLEAVRGEVRERFEKSDLVIAKGSANYQTLEGEPKRTYFLLAVKCEVVARHLGVRVGDVVVHGD